jgi:hypothetical protein
MKRPSVELVRFISFDKAESYRRRGYKVAPHPHGNHKRFGMIASKPAKPKKRGRR